ncbi:MAG: glycosyltransferase [bacterium]
MSEGGLKVAIVHDELTRRGGAEVVLEELLRLFPKADVYALFAGRPLITVDGKNFNVRTSFLQRWPLWFRRHPARLLALLPHAAEQFDLSGYDLVISSASGFAKSVVTRVNVPHLCYCHAPTRYLWDTTHEIMARQRWLLRGPGAILLHYLRLADFTASQRVDVFLANSQYTQRRIDSYYRRSSTVVYPPIDTVFYTPSFSAKRSYFLTVGRLTATKYYEQAVSVCEKLELPLVIVGKGYCLPRLKRLAGKYTRFAGDVSSEQLRDYLRGARALLQPGREDFGMATAEALSCGTPVIALGSGGAEEVVEQNVTGVLYNTSMEEALAEAMRQFLNKEKTFAAEVLQQSVLKFSRARFGIAIEQQVGLAIDRAHRGMIST